MRDLTIGPNVTLYLGDTTSLYILGNGVLINDGTFNVTGYISIRDQNNTNNTAFLNNGTFSITMYGGLSIQEIGDYGVRNSSTGVMQMEGFSNIESFESEVAKSALLE